MAVGYTVVAFNQIVHKKIEKKTLINTLDPLLKQLRTRPGVVFLKRLTIILDEDSEKGFGLVSLISHYCFFPCSLQLIVDKCQRVLIGAIRSDFVDPDNRSNILSGVS